MQFEHAEWRLIVEDTPRSGAANMALDQAIADACAQGASPPTLRFYRWSPPAVSIGRHQPVSDVDLVAARELGYDVVRRPTGGRAILHTDELTYSVTAPANDARVQGSVMDAYLRLSNALLAGLVGIGLAADKAPGDIRAGPDVSAACFEAPSAYEITAGGPTVAVRCPARVEQPDAQGARPQPLGQVRAGGLVPAQRERRRA